MIEATAADEYGAAWTIAATTGLRLGEILGLAFDDIGTKAGNCQSVVPSHVTPLVAGRWRSPRLPEAAEPCRCLPPPALR